MQRQHVTCLTTSSYTKSVVNALVKLEILKAIHNYRFYFLVMCIVVNALVKLEILKAIHNVLCG